MKINNILIASLSLTIFVSYSDVKSETNLSMNEKKIIQRTVNPRIYSQGQKLYQLNCAQCHGRQGEGAQNWRVPDKDGKNPAPPLNGAGHTWHHSTKALTSVIKNGTGKIGGNMPAWKDKLSNHEITLILTWITSQWPDEIYTAWYNQHHQEK